MQRFIQEDSREVAGERPAGAIGAVHSRREPHDEQLRRCFAKRRHGFAVVVGKLVLGRGEKRLSRGQSVQSGQKVAAIRLD